MAVLFFFGPDVRADCVPERVFLSAKNPANANFGHAPLVCRQPVVHQLFDPHDAQPFVLFLKKSRFRKLLDKPERAHHRNSGRSRKLRSAVVASTRRGEINLRNVRRQENFEHPLIQVGKKLRRRYAMGRR
jgi:hypothetical protein